jgi:broad specificity phosphatase PhoE
LDELREMNYGGWEGRSFLDVRRDDEEIYQRWIADEEATCPSGESHADVRRRLEQRKPREMKSRTLALFG